MRQRILTFTWNLGAMAVDYVYISSIKRAWKEGRGLRHYIASNEPLRVGKMGSGEEDYGGWSTAPKESARYFLNCLCAVTCARVTKRQCTRVYCNHLCKWLMCFNPITTDSTSSTHTHFFPPASAAAEGPASRLHGNDHPVNPPKNKHVISVCPHTVF